MGREWFPSKVWELGGYGSVGSGRENIRRDRRISIKCWKLILQNFCSGDSVTVSSSINDEVCGDYVLFCVKHPFVKANKNPNHPRFEVSML